jgi:hypothetical protein
MAAPTQNQAQVGPPVNVLHDQNSPNTLGGIGPPTTASDRLPVGVLGPVAESDPSTVAWWSARFGSNVADGALPVDVAGSAC